MFTFRIKDENIRLIILTSLLSLRQITHCRVGSRVGISEEYIHDKEENNSRRCQLRWWLCFKPTDEIRDDMM